MIAPDYTSENSCAIISGEFWTYHGQTGKNRITSCLPTIRELCVFARIEMPLGTKRARTPITQA
jgi:hypothetical protein